MANVISTFFFLAVIITVIVVVSTRLQKVSQWNRTYLKLSRRYGGIGKGLRKGAKTFATVFGLKKPSLRFNYGRTYCWLKNRKRADFSTSRSTEISMNWPQRNLILEIATFPRQSFVTGKANVLRQVSVEDPQFQSNFYVSSNKPVTAKRILNNGVQWQLEQLRRHMGNQELLVTIVRGKLTVCKPGYIKSHQELEDFVRFSLNLFDQMMLVDAKGIEFVNDNEASVVNDVKCPICSEEIMHNMVVCSRCKTPHCLDCWQYNGQCATFACSEKRFISTRAIGAYDS